MHAALLHLSSFPAKRFYMTKIRNFFTRDIKLRPGRCWVGGVLLQVANVSQKDKHVVRGYLKYICREIELDY